MTNRAYEKDLRAIIEALSDWVATTSDEELVEDAKESGENISADAESLKAHLLGIVKKEGLAQLKAARTKREEALKRLKTEESSLPVDAGARRQLFYAVLKRNSQVADRMTLQYRNLEEMSDSDIVSALRDFQILGILGDHLYDEKGKK